MDVSFINDYGKDISSFDIILINDVYVKAFGSKGHTC